MVFIFSLDHDILALAFNHVGCILVNLDYRVLCIQGIPFRGLHFLDPVPSKLQAVREDQGSFRVSKVGSMPDRVRVGCHLLHILFIVKIEDLKLRVREQYIFLCLIILLDDLQLRLELFIQEHPPDLRLIREVLCYGDLEIINRVEVVRRGCFLYDISSVRDRNGQRVSPLIREKLPASVFIDHDRLG